MYAIKALGSSDRQISGRLGKDKTSKQHKMKYVYDISKRQTLQLVKQSIKITIKLDMYIQDKNLKQLTRDGTRRLKSHAQKLTANDYSGTVI